MTKTLIPKSIILDEEKIKKITRQFPFLTKEDISNMKYWNDPDSPYSGTIIDEDASIQAFPYDGSQEQFSEEFMGGIIWK
jgi:hypothetical protein